MVINLRKVIGLSMLVFIIDQMIKLYIVSLPVHKIYYIIPNFFSIVHAKNYGAAFNILTGNRIFLILIGLIALIVIFYLVRKETFNAFKIITYGFLFGGIIGNLFDRIIRGYVVDYLQFKIFDHYFPVFNLADMMIVIGTILIIIMTVKGENNGKDSSK